MGIRRIQRGRNHGYTINGSRAIGVTTALSKGFPKPALVGWAAKCAAEEAAELLGMPDEQWRQWRTENKVHSHQELINHLRTTHIRRRDNAALRGTKVHKYAEDLVYGRDVEVPIELAGHVAQAARFMDEWKVRPILVEKVVGSYRYGFAGTFDVVAEIPDGRRILWDYKTGASGVWPDVAMQLAAYRHADAYVADAGLEIPLREVGITDAKAVHITADGYQVIPLDTGPAVYKAFLHVLQVAKAAEVMDAWKGEPEVCPS